MSNSLHDLLVKLVEQSHDGTKAAGNKLYVRIELESAIKNNSPELFLNAWYQLSKEERTKDFLNALLPHAKSEDLIDTIEDLRDVVDPLATQNTMFRVAVRTNQPKILREALELRSEKFIQGSYKPEEQRKLNQLLHDAANHERCSHVVAEELMYVGADPTDKSFDGKIVVAYRLNGNEIRIFRTEKEGDAPFSYQNAERQLIKIGDDNPQRLGQLLSSQAGVFIMLSSSPKPQEQEEPAAASPLPEQELELGMIPGTDIPMPQIPLAAQAYINHLLANGYYQKDTLEDIAAINARIISGGARGHEYTAPDILQAEFIVGIRAPIKAGNNVLIGATGVQLDENGEIEYIGGVLGAFNFNDHGGE